MVLIPLYGARFVGGEDGGSGTVPAKKWSINVWTAVSPIPEPNISVVEWNMTMDIAVIPYKGKKT